MIVFFCIFISFGFFTQVLEFHEMIRVHLVACPIVFILFDHRDWQGGVLQFMKNDQFLVFSAVWILFPKFFGRLWGDLC